jgi:purine-binding chemotaxis protein CheW
MQYETDQEYRFCTFYLGDDRYAIDILAIREINRDTQITPTRGSIPCVRGLLNLRGQIVTIIDPATVLGLPRREIGKESRLVVLKTNAELDQRGLTTAATCDDMVGFLVDRVSDVVNRHGRDIRSAPAQVKNASNEHTLAGVIHLDDELVRVLDTELLLDVEVPA